MHWKHQKQCKDYIRIWGKLNVCIFGGSRMRTVEKWVSNSVWRYENRINPKEENNEMKINNEENRKWLKSEFFWSYKTGISPGNQISKKDRMTKTHNNNITAQGMKNVHIFPIKTQIVWTTSCY